MNRAGPAVAASLLLAAAMVWSGAAGGAEPPPAAAQERAVADVGGRTILLADLEGYLRIRAPERGAEPNEEGIRARLEELVQAEALYAEALRRGVDREPDVRQMIRQLVVQRLLEREVERPALERKIGEEELKSFYESHLADYVRPQQARAADIFFSAPAGGDPGVREEKRRKAEAVHAEAVALQDTRFGFGELVAKHSDEPQGRPKGDTGFFDREGKPAGIPAALAEAVLAMEKPGGMLRGVVATPEGFYVAMLTGRRAAMTRPFEDAGVRREIDDRIRTDERRRRREEFVKGVRGDAGVKVDEAALGDLVARMRSASRRETPGGGVSLPGAGNASQAPPAMPEIGR